MNDDEAMDEQAAVVLLAIEVDDRFGSFTHEQRLVLARMVVRISSGVGAMFDQFEAEMFDDGMGDRTLQ
jgi:hypothetical protein